MNINKTIVGEITIFVLEGRLDTTTASQLQAVLIPEFDTAKEIMLNLQELAYISSAGLRVILMASKAAKKKESKFILTNVSEEIMEVFEMTGFSDILTIE